MRRHLPFLAGFVLASGLYLLAACEGGVTTKIGDLVSDPAPAVAEAQANADRVIREATARAAEAETARATAEAARAAAETARQAAEARANDASLTAEQRAKAAEEAKAEAAKAKDAAAAAAAAEVERKRAQDMKDVQAGFRSEVERLKTEVSTIKNIPIPKGTDPASLLAWAIGLGASGGGFVGWLVRLLGPTRKKLDEILEKSKQKTEEWDRETRMTMEDAAELAPLLAQLKAGAPPATGV